MTDRSGEAGGTGLFHTKSEANYNRSRASKKRYYSGQNNLSKPPKARKQPKTVAHAKRDQVAELLAEGFGLAVIAERLGITPKAVEHHLAAIRKRLGPQAR